MRTDKGMVDWRLDAQSEVESVMELVSLSSVVAAFQPHRSERGRVKGSRVAL